MALNVGIGERVGDSQEAERRGLENALANVRVAMPGEIVDFNAANQTSTVQPLIKELVRGEWRALPRLPDVPCVFPRAGGYCLTFPVKPGDECLIVFNDMCLDAWWQSGGLQTQAETRRHDLSDACCILGPTSAPWAVKEYSQNSVMLRNEDGDSYLEIVDGDKTFNIVGAEKINIKAAADILAEAQADITVSAKSNIAVNAEANVSVGAASNITVNAEANIDVNAQAAVTINAQANIDIISQSALSVNAQTNITVNAQGGLAIKSAGPMTLESDTSISLKAPVVNIDADIAHDGSISTSGTHSDSVGGHI